MTLDSTGWFLQSLLDDKSSSWQADLGFEAPLFLHVLSAVCSQAQHKTMKVAMSFKAETPVVWLYRD